MSLLDAAGLASGGCIGLLSGQAITPSTAVGGVSPLVVYALAAALATIHMIAVRLTFLDAIPRSRVLSLSGGVSVSYVFLHMLPELERAAPHIEEGLAMLPFLEDHVYLLALGGFSIYYGLERFVRQSKDHPSDRPGVGVFWLHIGSFTVYNGLVGYLLFQERVDGVTGLLLFSLAMGLHFLVNDYALHDHHQRLYRNIGRWILAAGVVAGSALGSVVRFDEALVAGLFAFIAGGVVLNAVKEELPPERESRFWAFFAGAAAYAVLLLIV